MKTVTLDGNTWQFVFTLRTYNPATGRWDLDDTATVVAYFAATEGGAAIDPALQKTLALARAGSGEYQNNIPGADLTSKLAAYVDGEVYEVYQVGTAFRVAERVRVRDVRRSDDP